jgi:SsrA-binding protein
MAILLSYKRGLRNYTVIDTWEAGISLLGIEVKSLRGGRGSLEGSFISITGGELWLRKSFIPPYQEKNTPKSYNPNRDRKLLLRKQDIAKISAKVSRSGFTLVPLHIHTRDSNHTIGVSLALVRHANKHDKRQKIKARDTERELQREIKGRIRINNAKKHNSIVII